MIRPCTTCSSTSAGDVGKPATPTRPRFARDRPGEARLGLLVGLITLVVFLPAVACDFVNWDDNSYVYDNPLVLGGLTAPGILRAWTETVFGGWQPLTVLSYQLDATIAGARPWCYHLTNVVGHALAAGLLAVVLIRMTGCPVRSSIAAAVFAVHPLRVESVAWISERKDVLSVLFLMLALVAYERFCKRPSPVRYGLVAAAMLASLLSKSTLVTLPLLLALCDLWPLGRIVWPAGWPLAWLVGTVNAGTGRYPPVSLGRAVAEKIPLLALSAVFAVVTLRTQAEFVSSPLGLSWSRARLPNAIEAIGFYLGKSLWPTNLQPAIYHVGTDRDPGALVAGLAATGALFGIMILARTRLPAVAWGCAWFAVALLPMLGLVQTGFQAYCDRFSYVPHVGLAVAMTWAAAAGGARLGISPRAMLATAVLVAAVLAGLSVRQIGVWRDGQTLWLHVLRLEPDHPIALGKLGNLAFLGGDLHSAERLYRASLERQEYGWVIAGLARTYHRLGDEAGMRRYRDWAARVGDADRDTRRILAELPARSATAPGDPSHRPPLRPLSGNVRGLLEAGSRALAGNDFARALAAFDAAAAADGDAAAAHNLAGIALVALDRHPEAAARFARAARLEPGNFGFWANLARTRADLLDWAGCFEAAERAAALDPSDAEVAALRDRARRRLGGS